mmetsp:Transcript_124178/g.362393  ORF Transcript_124178/g.362393 Transcript_124178/m.362393 type:complete len:652 (-) Transcript_124178:1262-3217(-)
MERRQRRVEASCRDRLLVRLQLRRDRLAGGVLDARHYLPEGSLQSCNDVDPGLAGGLVLLHLLRLLLLHGRAHPGGPARGVVGLAAEAVREGAAGGAARGGGDRAPAGPVRPGVLPEGAGGGEALLNSELAPGADVVLLLGVAHGEAAAGVEAPARVRAPEDRVAALRLQRVVLHALGVEAESPADVLDRVLDLILEEARHGVEVRKGVLQELVQLRAEGPHRHLDRLQLRGQHLRRLLQQRDVLAHHLHREPDDLPLELVRVLVDVQVALEEEGVAPVLGRHRLQQRGEGRLQRLREVHPGAQRPRHGAVDEAGMPLQRRLHRRRLRRQRLQGLPEEARALVEELRLLLKDEEGLDHGARDLHVVGQVLPRGRLQRGGRRARGRRDRGRGAGGARRGARRGGARRGLGRGRRRHEADLPAACPHVHVRGPLDPALGHHAVRARDAAEGLAVDDQGVQLVLRGEVRDAQGHLVARRDVDDAVLVVAVAVWVVGALRTLLLDDASPLHKGKAGRDVLCCRLLGWRLGPRADLPAGGRGLEVGEPDEILIGHDSVRPTCAAEAHAIHCERVIAQLSHEPLCAQGSNSRGVDPNRADTCIGICFWVERALHTAVRPHGAIANSDCEDGVVCFALCAAGTLRANLPSGAEVAVVC